MEEVTEEPVRPKIQLQSRGSMTQNNGLTRIALFALPDFKRWLQEPLTQRGSELDRFVQRPIRGAVHGVDACVRSTVSLTASGATRRIAT